MPFANDIKNINTSPIVEAILYDKYHQMDQDQVSEPGGGSSQGDKGEIVCEEGEKNEFQTEKIRKLENLLTKCKVIFENRLCP